MTQTLGVNTSSKQEISLLGGHPAVLSPITLASTGASLELKRGTVLGKVTSSGKYIAFDPDDSPSGIGTAAVILAVDVTVPASGDEKAVAYVHGEFHADALTWTHDGITDNEKTTALASLFSAGMFCK